MTDNGCSKRTRPARYGRISMPILIGLAGVMLIAGFMLLNWVFYGKSVAVLEQRVVLADIGDFTQFVRDCTDDLMSTSEIVTMRDEPTGNFLVLRLQLLTKHIYAKKGTQVGQIILHNTDFVLTSGDRNQTSILLRRGNEITAGELLIGSLEFRRASDGGIECAEAGSGSAEDKPTLGDVARGVKQLHRAASIGGGRGRRGVLDWVPAPLEERSKIIQPPALSGYVCRAERSQNIQDAWRSAEMVCLFPLPAPGTTANLVVFGDNATAIPIAVR